MVKRLILLLAAAVGPCLPAGLRAGKDRSTTAVTKFLRRDPRTARRPSHACKQVVLMGDLARAIHDCSGVYMMARKEDEGHRLVYRSEESNCKVERSTALNHQV